MMTTYSFSDVSSMLEIEPAQMRYWMQVGLIAPTTRRGGKFFYSFRDMVCMKMAKEFSTLRMSPDRTREALGILRNKLDANVTAESGLRVCSDGERVEVLSSEEVMCPTTGNVLLAFGLANLMRKDPEVPAWAMSDKSRDIEPIPLRIPDTPEQATAPHKQPSAYECFLSGYESEKNLDHKAAETWYLRALAQEDSMAAAHTNLGNLYHRQGELEKARDAYQKAVDYEPDQAEARFNLGNLLDEMGQTQAAISELRQVCARRPNFADAQFNLGLLLARVGGLDQASFHLTNYLETDKDSVWAEHARKVLSTANSPTALQRGA